MKHPGSTPLQSQTGHSRCRTAERRRWDLNPYVMFQTPVLKTGGRPDCPTTALLLLVFDALVSASRPSSRSHDSMVERAQHHRTTRLNSTLNRGILECFDLSWWQGLGSHRHVPWLDERDVNAESPCRSGADGIRTHNSVRRPD